MAKRSKFVFLVILSVVMMLGLTQAKLETAEGMSKGLSNVMAPPPDGTIAAKHDTRSKDLASVPSTAPVALYQHETQVDQVALATATPPPNQGEDWYEAEDGGIRRLGEHYPRLFAPGWEWRPIRPGQHIPGGLDVRVSLSGSGQREARLLPQRQYTPDMLEDVGDGGRAKQGLEPLGNGHDGAGGALEPSSESIAQAHGLQQGVDVDACPESAAGQALALVPESAGVASGESNGPVHHDTHAAARALHDAFEAQAGGEVAHEDEDSAQRARAVQDKIDEALRRASRKQRGNGGEQMQTQTENEGMDSGSNNYTALNLETPDAAIVSGVPQEHGGERYEEEQGGGVDVAETSEAAAEMRRILTGLPQPEPEVSEALAAGLEGPELDALLKRVWVRRQKDLRRAMESARTEAQQMQELMAQMGPGGGAGHDHGGQYQDADDSPTSDRSARVAALESLEFHVSKRHNADDFARMGGMVDIAPLWNHSEPLRLTSRPGGDPAPNAASDLSATALWVLGSATKYNPVAGEAALETGAMPLVLRALEANALAARWTARRALEAARENLPAAEATLFPALARGNGSDVGPSVLQEMRRGAAGAGKAMYALGGLLRGGREAQRQAEILEAGRVIGQALVQLGEAARGMHEAATGCGGHWKGAFKAQRQLRRVAGKGVRLLGDLAHELRKSGEGGGERVGPGGVVEQDGKVTVLDGGAATGGQEGPGDRYIDAHKGSGPSLGTARGAVRAILEQATEGPPAACVLASPLDAGQVLGGQLDLEEDPAVGDVLEAAAEWSAALGRPLIGPPETRKEWGSVACGMELSAGHAAESIIQGARAAAAPSGSAGGAADAQEGAAAASVPGDSDAVIEAALVEYLRATDLQDQEKVAVAGRAVASWAGT